MITAQQSFDRLGPAVPQSPVVVSVPHAGRAYSPALLAAVRLPLSALLVLEDRYVDAVAKAARRGETALVQRVPRAWIDLNRAEYERDPKLDDGADPRAQPGASAKLRGGLGLVPRRVAQGGDIWRKRLAAADVDARIEQAYRPYHAELARALAAARARFGVAILLDVHSMPPLRLAGEATGEAAGIVLGDRFGQSAADRFVARLQAEMDGCGVPHMLNTPYAGGHILERHAAPARGIHAIQIEFDRRLYLDAVLRVPGAGLHPTARLLRCMIDALVDEALGTTQMAAE